jgi:hypothetical protein
VVHLILSQDEGPVDNQKKNRMLYPRAAELRKFTKDLASFDSSLIFERDDDRKERMRSNKSTQ